MLLAIDVGNTNTVLGLFDGERIVEHWRLATDAAPHGRRARAARHGPARGLDSATRPDRRRDRVLLDGAVGAARDAVDVRALSSTRVPLVIVEPGIRTGVPILYDNPKEVGADRIVNALAAYHLYGGPAIVVDFGTATNFDVVSAKGEFLGGALAPGIEISRRRARRRGRLSCARCELVRPRSVIGKNTVESLQSGIIYGFAGAGRRDHRADRRRTRDAARP